MGYTIRSARTRDVPMIRKLIDSNVESGRLLSKATVTLYEDVQEFCVAELSHDATLAGCGALHVMWEDLAEIRTVAVREDCQGLGIGHGIVDALLQRARAVGVDRVFVLDFRGGLLRPSRILRAQRHSRGGRGVHRAIALL